MPACNRGAASLALRVISGGDPEPQGQEPRGGLLNVHLEVEVVGTGGRAPVVAVVVVGSILDRGRCGSLVPEPEVKRS